MRRLRPSRQAPHGLTGTHPKNLHPASTWADLPRPCGEGRGCAHWSAQWQGVGVLLEQIRTFPGRITHNIRSPGLLSPGCRISTQSPNAPIILSSQTHHCKAPSPWRAARRCRRLRFPLEELCGSRIRQLNLSMTDRPSFTQAAITTAGGAELLAAAAEVPAAVAAALADGSGKKKKKKKRSAADAAADAADAAVGEPPHSELPKRLQLWQLISCMSANTFFHTSPFFRHLLPPLQATTAGLFRIAPKVQKFASIGVWSLELLFESNSLLSSRAAETGAPKKKKKKQAAAAAVGAVVDGDGNAAVTPAADGEKKKKKKKKAAAEA